MIDPARAASRARETARARPPSAARARTAARAPAAGRPRTSHDSAWRRQGPNPTHRHRRAHVDRSRRCLSYSLAGLVLLFDLGANGPRCAGMLFYFLSLIIGRAASSSELQSRDHYVPHTIVSPESSSDISTGSDGRRDCLGLGPQRRAGSAAWRREAFPMGRPSAPGRWKIRDRQPLDHHLPGPREDHRHGHGDLSRRWLWRIGGRPGRAWDRAVVEPARDRGDRAGVPAAQGQGVCAAVGCAAGHPHDVRFQRQSVGHRPGPHRHHRLLGGRAPGLHGGHPLRLAAIPRRRIPSIV